MEISVIENKDGEVKLPILEVDTPSIVDVSKQKPEGTVKKKRRRGKSKRKILKPFMKVSWQDRRKLEISKRNNRFRKIVLAKTHAPFNNNQFLMEIHKPEPENNFQIFQTPSARTRDSSFSVDSEDNYFFSLPEDEEEYLTKEFSSVYEDAQSERLSNMSKNELIQEYLLLEAKYDNLVKRTERSKSKCTEDDKDITVADKDTFVTDKDSMLTDRNTSGASLESSVSDEYSIDDVMRRLKEQDDQIRELQLANEKLRLENEHLRQKSQSSSSADSESDSSSTSESDSSSSLRVSPISEAVFAAADQNHINHEVANNEDLSTQAPLINGFHNPNDHNN